MFGHAYLPINNYYFMLCDVNLKLLMTPEVNKQINKIKKS